MFNEDGSEGMMCGNGIRCVGKYVYDHNIVDRLHITVETLGGIKKLEMTEKDGKVEAVQVDMGIPVLTSELPEKIVIEGIEQEFVGIDVGNPHAVYFWPEIDHLDLEKIGPGYECHTRFPDRVNTEFVRVMDREHLQMRVWERGTGETLACGTGACASVVASVLNGLTQEQVTVKLLGGNLQIRWDREEDLVYMTGPAATVFEGEIE